jgi:uncharacterized protein involved in exopolysaccharide biosynthesis
MRSILVVLAMFLSIPARGDSQTEAETKRVEAQLQRVQQEQQSVYQQFQMIQELRRTELQAVNPEVVQNSPDYGGTYTPPNFDDVAKEKSERDDRIRQYTADLNRLYVRHRELEAQKKALLDRLDELAQTR